MIAVLIISMIGLSTGFYFKFVKSYLEGVQIKAANEHGESSQRNLTLGEYINFLETLDQTFSSHGIENKENVAALRMLKRINLLATSTMIVSIVFLLWAIMGLAKVKRRIGRE